ncbi:MAG: HAD-IIB family hydrolase [Planctomycetota bacterium]
MSNRFIVFTDLDGSLLNEDDYKYDGATNALKRLSELGIPLVLSSSKTANEMMPLAAELGTDAPVIFENGGGVAWPDGTIENTGVPRSNLLSTLDELRQQGFDFWSFRDMGVEGVMQSTGLDRQRATLALDRHATEPLLWRDSSNRLDLIREILEAKGLRLIKGGRFFHVSGQIDKAIAMRQVVERFRVDGGSEVATIAVGDSPNDASMLRTADFAVLIPGHEGVKFDLNRESARIAPCSGSEGWGRAVTMLLDELIP